MSAARLRQIALLGVAAAGYVALNSALFGLLPFASVPEAWSAAGPSRRSAVLSWWQLLDACGALASAIPIALLRHRFVGRPTLRTDLAVATPAAVVALAGLAAYPALLQRQAVAAVTTTLALAAYLLAAVPLCRAVMGRIAAGVRSGTRERE